MTHARGKHSRRPMFILILIVIIFMVPFFIARFLSKEPDSEFKTTNYGFLLKPPLDIAKFKIYNQDHQLLNNQFTDHYIKPSATRTTGKWLLLTINPNTTCDVTCAKSLFLIRQIRVATNKNKNRIERAILTFRNGPHKKLKEILAGPYKGTYDLNMDWQQFKQQLARVNNPHKLANGAIYLVDPLGNIMMLYAPDAKPMKLLKDLDKLLKISQIG